MRSIEICAGAGGQALGLEQAGFEHVALVEIDGSACATLRKNRPQWNVVEGDVKSFSATAFEEIDLFAGGVPCPFSIAGKQLGQQDERDLFPEAIRLIEECNPKAIMLENMCLIEMVSLAIDKSMGGTDDASNLRALCSVCNEGAANLTLDRPSHEKLLIQIRRAAGADQLKVLEWLIKKYPKQAKELIDEL